MASLVPTGLVPSREAKEVGMFPARILLATDGSPGADLAARMAVKLSNDLHSELHLLYVEERPAGAYIAPMEAPLDREFEESARERIERDAREKLEGQIRRVKESGGEVAGVHVKIGRPDAEIVHFAEELGAGLTVVGSRGLGPLRRALMGSVSNSVVRHAHGSVLVVGGDQYRAEDYLPGRILVPIDGSRGAYAAAEAAAEISNATGSELHLHHVLPMEWLAPLLGPEAWEMSEVKLEQRKRTARSFLDREAERIEAGGGRVTQVHVSFGESDAEIVRLAEELDAGLTVIGSRGLGGVRRALIGSVSDSVVRHAHCPVLVVREG